MGTIVKLLGKGCHQIVVLCLLNTASMPGKFC